MEKPYHIVEKKDTEGWANFLAKNGQALLPMLEFIEQSQVAVDEFIDVVGRATLEALLRLSAEGGGGAAASGEERWGHRLAWRGARHDLPERTEAAGEAAALAQEGGEGRG